jgi:hypothetical protein
MLTGVFGWGWRLILFSQILFRPLHRKQPKPQEVLRPPDGELEEGPKPWPATCSPKPLCVCLALHCPRFHACASAGAVIAAEAVSGCFGWAAGGGSCVYSYEFPCAASIAAHGYSQCPSHAVGSEHVQFRAFQHSGSVYHGQSPLSSSSS